MARVGLHPMRSFHGPAGRAVKWTQNTSLGKEQDDESRIHWIGIVIVQGRFKKGARTPSSASSMRPYEKLADEGVRAPYFAFLESALVIVLWVDSSPGTCHAAME